MENDKTQGALRKQSSNSPKGKESRRKKQSPENLPGKCF